MLLYNFTTDPFYPDLLSRRGFQARIIQAEIAFYLSGTHPYTRGSEGSSPCLLQVGPYDGDAGITVCYFPAPPYQLLIFPVIVPQRRTHQAKSLWKLWPTIPP